MTQKDALLTTLAGIDPYLLPCTAEDLTVTAWRLHPRLFGLRGFSDQYPDSNRVGAALCGKSGLVARGLAMRAGGRLRPTPAGWERVQKLRAEAA